MSRLCNHTREEKVETIFMLRRRFVAAQPRCSSREGTAMPEDNSSLDCFRGGANLFLPLFRGILIRIFWNAIRRRRQSDWRIGFTPPTELRPRDQNYIPGKNRLPNQERNHISLARCTTGFITFLEPGSRSAQSSPLLDNVVAGTINAKTGHTKRISTT